MDWDSPIFTYQGCVKFMGGSRWYQEAGSRMYTWVIPVLFLLFNIALGSASKWSLFAIAHSLGDPIDTNRSLLDKLSAWNTCYDEANAVVLEKWRAAYSGQGGAAKQAPDEHLLIDDVCIKDSVRTLATVFAGMEELVGHHPGFETVYREAAQEWHALDETALGPGRDRNDFVSIEWRRAALTLTENRTNEFVRTILAVGVYYFAIVAEFVGEISGNGDATPAGRIGAAMALSFILAVTLLSNLPGSFPSRRTCLDAILRLAAAETSRSGPESAEMQPTQPTRPSQQQRQRQRQQSKAPPTPIVLVSSSSSSQYFDSLPFAGANYSFRPWKRLRCRRMALATPWVALIPLALAFVPAMILLHYAVPRGFGCRHFMILGIFGAWIISTLLTHLFQQLANRVDTVRWRTFCFWLTYGKDLVIGIPAITMVFLSVAGMFSNCWCWCRVLFLGEDDASLPLDVKQDYLQNKTTRFVAIVVAFQAFQMLYIIIVARLSRRGRRLALWGEEAKRKVWRQVYAGIGGGQGVLRLGTRFILWGGNEGGDTEVK